MKKGDKYIHFDGLQNTGLFIRGNEAFLVTDYSKPSIVKEAVTKTKSILLSMGLNPVIDPSLTS